MRGTAISNNTNSSFPGEIPLGFQADSTEVALKLLGCVLVGILSIAGNAVVVVVVFKVPRMKTATFYLLVNMAISDLLFTFISLPPFMLGVTGRGLLFGGSAGVFLCKFLNPLGFGLMASSVLSMTAIAFDRYFAVKMPTRKIIHGKILKGVIVLIWIITLLVMAPLIWSYNLRGEEGNYYCDEDWPVLMGDPYLVSKIYTVILFCVIYMIPFTCMGVLYFIVGHHLWFRKIVGSVNVKSQKYARKRRQKVVCMLIIVLVVFIACWLPLQVVSFVFYFSDVMISRNALFVAEFLVRANGALNPLCYICFSETFRQGVLQVAPFRYCFKRQEDDSYSLNIRTPRLGGQSFRSSSYRLFRKRNRGHESRSEMETLQ